ncbi:hypothetical protein [Flavobacterium lipolyticum]|uniref:Uncharacterized protein n=1 Tax=Flavobacterium lipolyticum TaxID=2893754 RepID=A0ABS8M2B6_9FLAO|nr:hypothetical protein [Flavobacterium sp. F-126]MCC9018950.1 hypothetical protein [Flavobacterium sp. F-126]
MSIIHLMYQFVVLPTLKQSLNFKLHKLNDEVISMVIEDKKSVPPIEFNFTTHIISAVSDNLSDYNLITLFRRKKTFENEKVIKSKIKEIEAQIYNERLKEIHEKCLTIAFKSLIYNSLMLLVYLLPIFIVLYIISKLFFGYSKNIKKLYLNMINNRVESNFTSSNNLQKQYCY